MENAGNEAKQDCKCHGCSCGSCWAKVAIGLWLFLVGAIGGYGMGHCCAMRSYHHGMMSCPISMPVAATAPTK